MLAWSGLEAEGAAGGFSMALRCLDPGCLACVIAWGALCFVNLSTLTLEVASSGKSPQFLDDIVEAGLVISRSRLHLL